jgi:hypothetical protein
MAWFIQADVNNGYPAQNTWKTEWETGWTSDGNIRYPDYMYRIKAGVNDGYPWIYPWYKEDTYDHGEMVIGGSQTNYPNGFSSFDIGGIDRDFDDISQITAEGGAVTNNIIINALSDRAFCINGNTLTGILQNLNDGSIFDSRAEELISHLYGANVYDCFVSCKAFPFDLTQLSYGSIIAPVSVVSSNTGYIKAFGRYQLSDVANNLLASSFGFYQFPTIHVAPEYAWEVENISFSLYLPMSGIYPIDIKGECDVDILLYCDLLSGAGEYNIYIDGQQYASFRVLLGEDVPLNTNQGKMESNMLSNVISAVGTLGGAVAGGIVGGIGGAVGGATMTKSILYNPKFNFDGKIISGESGLGSSIGSDVGHVLNHLTPTYSITSPTIGGLTSIQCNGYPRIIAKIPKMFKMGYGLKETLGLNRSTTYVRLSECSGFTKCRNYKTDIIVATSEEKAEIEQLMNSGVFM